MTNRKETRNDLVTQGTQTDLANRSKSMKLWDLSASKNWAPLAGGGVLMVTVCAAAFTPLVGAVASLSDGINTVEDLLMMTTLATGAVVASVAINMSFRQSANEKATDQLTQENKELKALCADLIQSVKVLAQEVKTGCAQPDYVRLPPKKAWSSIAGSVTAINGKLREEASIEPISGGGGAFRMNISPDAISEFKRRLGNGYYYRLILTRGAFAPTVNTDIIALHRNRYDITTIVRLLCFALKLEADGANNLHLIRVHFSKADRTDTQSTFWAQTKFGCEPRRESVLHYHAPLPEMQDSGVDRVGISFAPEEVQAVAASVKIYLNGATSWSLYQLMKVFGRLIPLNPNEAMAPIPQDFSFDHTNPPADETCSEGVDQPDSFVLGKPQKTLREIHRDLFPDEVDLES